MSHPERALFDKLGADGLARVMHDILDHGRLVRLANTCGLRYPGMRTRSQTRGRLLADLVERAGRQEATLKAIHRMLQKETSAASRRWSRLSEEDKLARLAEPALAADGKIGLHLYLLARDKSEDGLQDRLAQLLRRSDLRPEPPVEPDRPSTKLTREATRLKKKVTELQKKLKHLDGQLAKSRDSQKTLKRDLLQRKGELAESRMLAERARRQLKEAQARAAPPTATAADEAIDKISKSVRKLATEQRKLTHAVEKLTETPAGPVTIAADSLEPVLEALKALQKETGALRRERRKDVKEQGQFLEQLKADLRKVKVARAQPASGAGSASRRKARPGRVGVFIDVQNMYYGARRLKGKLDFDALLQTAVRDRRMIQAKAYVVESKEIDQSGFISVLQQRAIEVQRKTLKVRADGSMKGDWDMEMALDILDAAPKLSVVVLVSGDGDFTSLVNKVKRIGPRVEVIGFPRTTAKSLVQAADHFQPLDRKFMIRTGDRSAARQQGQAARSDRRAASQERGAVREDRTAGRQERPDGAVARSDRSATPQVRGAAREDRSTTPSKRPAAESAKSPAAS